MRRISLKSKIAIFVMLIIFTCVPLAAHVTLSFLSDEFGRAVRDQQVTLVSRIADELDDKLQVSHGALILAAQSVTAAHLATPRAAREFLHTLPALGSLFDNGVFLFAADGKLLAGTIGEVARPGMDFSDREYVRSTVATGRPCISSPYISRQSHRHPVIMFTAPIFSRDGLLVALLGGSMDLMKENFLGSLADAKVGRTGYFYLFTADETIMTHPHRGSILNRGLPSGVRNIYARGADGGTVSGETVNANGEVVVTTVKRLGTVPWMLAADYPVAEAYAPVRATERSVWLGIIPGGLLLVFVMWLFMRHVTLPMLSLTEQIKGIEETGTYRNVLISSGDEIQTVADAFNSLMNRLHDKEETLVHLSTRDAMTGLYNRRFFEAEMERLDRGRRFPVSVIMVDVDSLKVVNDTLGHETGDRLILMAARALLGAFRAEDVTARIGGDEFAAILEGAGEIAAAEALARIRGSISACNGEKGDLRLSLSLGAATADAPGALGEAWRRADRRMYEDKVLHKSGLESQ
ncbi:GGDEF domain-containing protein [Geobacter sp.]|uniref:sensor domain-containing diguanylate cyclase n=1 Tax=Geobacter sp. TaxID=46610 RepID=UPI0027B97E8E|nr:GGDEF domain-containing protein [Geobacter sp.]